MIIFAIYLYYPMATLRKITYTQKQFLREKVKVGIQSILWNYLQVF